MILYNSEKSIHDIRTFCRLLFYHRSVVKYTVPYLSYTSEPVVRLGCQILLKSKGVRKGGWG